MSTAADNHAEKKYFLVRIPNINYSSDAVEKQT